MTSTALTPPTVPLVDPKTGLISLPWYTYLVQLNNQSNNVSNLFAAYRPVEAIMVIVTNETTAITTGTNKIRFRMPYAFALTSLKGSLSIAQPGGSIFTFDVTKAGTTIFSTKPTIDNTELTTVTAATPSVLSTTTFADDDLMAVNVTQVGTSGATGLKVTMIGTRI